MDDPLLVFSRWINDSADEDGQVVLVVVDVEDERVIHDELLFFHYAATHLVSISSTLNVRVFSTNVIWAAFSSYMYVEKAAETTFV